MNEQIEGEVRLTFEPKDHTLPRQMVATMERRGENDGDIIIVLRVRTMRGRHPLHDIPEPESCAQVRDNVEIGDNQTSVVELSLSFRDPLRRAPRLHLGQPEVRRIDKGFRASIEVEFLAEDELISSLQSHVGERCSWHFWEDPDGHVQHDGTGTFGRDGEDFTIVPDGIVTLAH